MAIRFEVRGRVALITIDRPQARNAIDRETDRELAQAWHRFAAEDGLWVAIVTGAGENFCAGADLRDVGEFYRLLSPLERLERAETEPGLGGITRNLEIWKPTIAAIDGYCLAGGFEIALACDLRIATESARFGLPEVSWGIVPGAGGTQRLPRLAPLGAALEIIMTGEAIGAAEALRLGIVNRVVPRERLLAEALGLAERIAANAPLAVRAAKKAVYRGLDQPLEQGLRTEQLLAEPVRQTEDAREGPAAFAEKRKPIFKGR